MNLKSPYVWTAPGWESEKPSSDPNADEVWVYTDRFSYVAGDIVNLRVHATAETFEIDIVRDGASPEQVISFKNLPGGTQDTPSNSYEVGCGWESAATFEIPTDWKSGFYLVVVRITDSAGAPLEREGFFVVRSPQPVSPVALILTTSTMTAYNDWGGANHYRGLSDDPRHDVHAPILSTLRPVAHGMCRLPPGAPRESHVGSLPPFAPPRYRSKEWARLTGRSRHYASAFWATYERHFVVWAESQGYELDYLTQQDLECYEGVLDSYNGTVIVGHDEYWSWNMRDALDKFTADGGSLVRFAGNFQWQVRLEDQGTRQICYKEKSADPVEDRRLTTIVWDHPMLGRPGAASIGLTGLGGIYTRYGGTTPRSSGGFTVYRPDHWLFEGTDLYYGDVIGAAPVNVAAFEVDGVDYTFHKGLPYPTHEDGAPESLEILAMTPAVIGEVDRWDGTVALNAPAYEFLEQVEEQFGDELPNYMRDRRYGAGMIGVCKREKGTIVNVGSTDWVSGLIHRDFFVERITRNALRLAYSDFDS